MKPEAKNSVAALFAFLCLVAIYGYSQDWYKYVHLYSVTSSAVTDVVFHGKVIDQHEAPVAGAKISYLITGQFLAAGAGSGSTRSDEQGNFVIDGEGAGVVIQDIIHPQINCNPPTPEQVPLLDAGKNPPISVKYNWDKYTIDNPYIFKAYRVEKYENVKTGVDGYPFSPKGEVYTYTPFVSDFRKRWVAGNSDGYLRASCERGEMRGGRDYQDWRVTLTPVDGGIQATDDIYMNEAPETGYQPSFVLEQKKSSPDFKPALANQRYYFTAHNGSVYGSLFVHYEPHFRNNNCSIRISYKINMEGSRNLAVMLRQY